MPNIAYQPLLALYFFISTQNFKLYLLMVAVISLSVGIILLHALWQVISPRDPSLPPVVFHWLPIIGSALAYGNNPIQFFFECREKYGNVFTFIMIGRSMTVALGPKGSHFVLGGKPFQVSAEEAYTHLMTPVFGKGVVFDVPNHVLMEQKRFVKFGLSTDNFRAYIGMIEDEIDKFINSDPTFTIYGSQNTLVWGEFNARIKMAELTILTAARTLLGKEVREKMDKTFAKRYEALDGGLTPLNFLFPNLPLESYRRRDKAQKQMSDFFVEIIQKRANRNTDHDHDMVTALSQQVYKDGRPLGEREMAHMMIALLMAGQHTSSGTSAWALLHLAEKPGVAEALYEEQVTHFSVGEGKFRGMTYEELKELPLLDSIIRETLRIHPPIHSMIRKVISDMPTPPTLATSSKDGQYIIPKGHFVLASPAFSQVDPSYWKNPNEWNPNRWIDPEGVAAQAAKMYDDAEGEKVDYGFGAISKGTESIYQPFGAGRHRCIGEQFAYIQLGVIIATFVRKMELKIQHRVPEHNYHTMVTIPKEPTGILYRRRHLC